METAIGLGPITVRLVGSNPTLGTKTPLDMKLSNGVNLQSTILNFYSFTSIFFFFSLSILGIRMVKIPSLKVALAFEDSTSTGKIISREKGPQ